MRSLRITLAILLFIGYSANAQDMYHVTRVNGELTNLSTGKIVEAGDALSSDDLILFESMESYAIAIGSSMGRFQIKIQDHHIDDQKQRLALTAKEAALPTKMRNLMLARFDPNQTEVSDLRQYFGNDKFSIIGDTVNVPLSEQKYPLSDDKFIVFYYKVDNNPVSKKIGHQQQTLVVDRDALVKSSVGAIDGNEITDLAVYEYEMSSRSGNEITRFTLVFVDKDELVNEFNTIIPILKRQRMSDEDIKKYLIEYYYDFYGATDSKTIDSFAEQIVKNF